MQIYVLHPAGVHVHYEGKSLHHEITQSLLNLFLLLDGVQMTKIESDTLAGFSKSIHMLELAYTRLMSTFGFDTTELRHAIKEFDARLR